MYFLLKTLALWLASLPTDKADRLARRIGTLVFDVLRLRRALILKNIAIAFPDPKMTATEREAIGRASVYNFACTILEFFRGWRDDVSATVRFENKELLTEVLSRKQGCYILCFHMGNWEAMGAAFTRQITPSYVLVKKVGGGGVNRFVTELREKIGFLSVKRKGKGDGYRQIVETLQRNEIIGFVMDQARPGEPKLPFFGQPAKTNTSFAAIWRRHPAPIVPAFATRHAFGQHTVHVLPEVKLTTTADTAKDILDQSLLFNTVIEEVVRRCPEQYFWMHNRWKE